MKVNQSADKSAKTEGGVPPVSIDGLVLGQQTLQAVANLLNNDPYALMQDFYQVHTYILRDMCAGDEYRERLDDLMQKFGNIIIQFKKEAYDERKS